MPILKFRCRDCGKEFAKIIVKAEQAPRSCPVCGAEDLAVAGPAFEGAEEMTRRPMCMTCDSCGEQACDHLTELS
jgi:putative FmdB family regulatory protein